MSRKQLNPVQQQIADLYNAKEYERMLYVADRYLQVHEDDKVVKKYVKKARARLGNSEVKWALAAVTVVMMLMTIGLYRMNNRIHDQVDMKNAQVSSLIDEIGQVREENQFLYERLQNSEKNLELAFNGLNTLDDKYSDLFTENKIQVKQTEAEFQELFSKNEGYKAPTNQFGGPTEIPAIDTAYEKVTGVLVLGNHKGLTDTIMLALVNPDTKRVSLVSIPRDLSMHGRKINSIYHRYGPEVLAQYLTELTGVPLHYYVSFNLQGFIDFVDYMGGVKVNNEKAINDAFYPGPNNTYQRFSLPAGEHTLNGETALKYARSRKTTSDFDRARRQQQIIRSLTESIRTYDFIANITQAKKLYNLLTENIKTNISFTKGIELYSGSRAFEIKSGNVLSTQNYLYPTRNIAGAYILLPNKRDFSEIKEYIKSLVVK